MIYSISIFQRIENLTLSPKRLTANANARHRGAPNRIHLCTFSSQRNLLSPFLIAKQYQSKTHCWADANTLPHASPINTSSIESWQRTWSPSFWRLIGRPSTFIFQYGRLSPFSPHPSGIFVTVDANGLPLRPYTPCCKKR